MSRALWKGIIRFGAISVPVKFYAAVTARSIHFRLLHRKDLVPVLQKMVNPATGVAVAHEEIRRGYETEEGDIVLLSDEELQSLEPEADRDVEVVSFLPAGLIGRQWYDRPYYLGPDTKQEAYSALAKTLEEEKKEGFARWSMRKKNYIGVLRSENGLLAMFTLRHAGEVVSAGELPQPSGRPLEKPELQMAEQLVQALEGSFDPAEYRDEYKDRVMTLVETKARGGTLEFKKAKIRKPKVASLTDLLQQSIRQAEKERKIA